MTHPITPPPELVQQWLNADAEKGLFAEPLAAKAAQWGADQELEACLRLVEIDAGEDAYDFARYIRAARRPKPPSLAEQAMEQLQAMEQAGALDCNIDAIRRALERLQELEKGNE